MTAISKTLQLYGSLVKFSHTVFALPFALAIIPVASRVSPPRFMQFVWILAALVSARTAAMSFNRIVDRHIDARNPRTKDRELPSGALNTGQAVALLAAASLAFFLSAAALGRHCLVLAPLVLGVLFFYSWTKRFTSLSHLVLGLCLSLAPAGVWYALTATVALPPIVIMAAIIPWVAGFDIIYSCQDHAFDVASGLYSLPARWGMRRSLLLARVLHGASLMALLAFGLLTGMHAPYYIGIAVFGILLISQHTLVSETDLSRVNAAFFSRNGLASMVFLAAVVADTLLS